MKITAFNPLIVSNKGEDIVKLFEDLGFSVKHKVSFYDQGDVTNYDLEDADGHKIDVAHAPNTPQDFTLVRMNVRDFDETYDFLIGRGFTCVQGGKAVETGSAKTAMMVSPSGFAFNLAQHITD